MKPVFAADKLSKLTYIKMFKLFVFLALVAFALATPKAEPQFYSGLYGGYAGLGYSSLGYGYAAPYAYGSLGYGYY
ncbi:unnamed protein product [Tenebrio molitor]|nr:unnamed protein product [Tenebrio molitor]